MKQAQRGSGLPNNGSRPNKKQKPRWFPKDLWQYFIQHTVMKLLAADWEMFKFFQVTDELSRTKYGRF
jgi:hypothetical protein